MQPGGSQPSPPPTTPLRPPDLDQGLETRKGVKFGRHRVIFQAARTRVDRGKPTGPAASSRQTGLGPPRDMVRARLARLRRRVLGAGYGHVAESRPFSELTVTRQGGSLLPQHHALAIRAARSRSRGSCLPRRRFAFSLVNWAKLGFIRIVRLG
jgi:hypothetical protein